MHAIDVSNVSKRFRRNNAITIKEYIVRGLWNRRPEAPGLVWALSEVNLKVRRGSTYAVIGQNGSGKSTLLKIIAGIIRPDEGDVGVNGKISALIELGAGFHPEFTGRENIYINGMLLGLTKKQINRKIDEIIDFAGLRDFINEPVRTYSSGMYSKLGFAVAVNVNPDILLIDEVFAVGDEEFVHKCKAKMDEFKRRGKTILFVTHSLHTVEQWCDEAMWLEYGVVKASGRSVEVTEAYKQKVMESENSTLLIQNDLANYAAGGVEEDGAGERQEDAGPHEAAGDGPAEGPSGTGKRMGTREAEITSVRMFGAGGEERYVFNTGEPIRLEVCFKADRPLQSLVCGIAILRSDGVWCFGTNTEIEKIGIKSLDGAGLLNVLLSDIRLLGGQYFIEAAIRSIKGHVYDYHSQMHRFMIKNEKEDLGVFRPSHSWEFSGGFSLAAVDAKGKDSRGRKRVIFCLIDAAQARRLGCYGHERRTTPNIDALARDGVIFENAFSQAPYTIASLCSLLSSRYPESHGVVARGKLPVDAATMPEIFRAGLFRTAGFSANPFFSRAFGLDRGFDVFREIFLEYGVTTEHVVSVPAEKLTDEAAAWIEENLDADSFVFIHYLQPHNPYDPPERFRRVFERGGGLEPSTKNLLEIDAGRLRVDESDLAHIKDMYDGNLAYVDSEIGRLVERLKAMGVYDDSMVVVLSDHGEAFGEHGRFLHNSTVYDEMIQVPLIMKMPASLGEEGKSVRAQVELIDVLPSVLDAFGISAEGLGFQGASFMPALNGAGARKYTFSRTVGEKPVYAVRGEGLKYIFNSETLSGELYDLSADRDEKKNIADERPEAAEALRKELFAWLDSQACPQGVNADVSLDDDIKERLKSLGYME